MGKKYLGIIVFCLVFLLLVFLSWKFLREKPQSQMQPEVRPTPVNAINLDLTAKIDLGETPVTSDHLLEVKYRWETGPAWTVPSGNLHIFVHIVDEDGLKLCQDDHNPPLHITEWQPNSVYEYSRLIYIPITLLKKRAFVLTGLYDLQDASRYFTLNGLQKFSDFYRYLGHEFVLLPSRDEYSESLIKYGSGWYGPELDKNGNVMRRWMQKRGEATLVNPKTDAYLYLHAWVPNQNFPHKAEITMTINGHIISLPDPVNDLFNIILDIPADQLGDQDLIPFSLETSQTFIPAQDGKSTDDRELGILIKKIMFRGKPDQKATKTQHKLEANVQ
ncbi:hypothetical protein JXQ70_03155 [bacterium]|nr:hypothetical protein [bacterium]